MKKIAIISLICIGYLQAQYNVLGSASPTNSLNCLASEDTCFTLTPNVPNQVGAVWYNQAVNLNQSLDGTFCIYLGNSDWSGGDGIAFSLQNAGLNAVGTGTEQQNFTGTLQSFNGLGYGGITPSFNVEFDTYPNDHPNNVYDGFDDHVSIHQDGDFYNPLITPVSYSNGGFSALTQDQTHTYRFVWEPTLNRLKIFFNGTQIYDYNIDLINNVFGGDTLVYWGFTGATGGSSNLQQVCFQAPEQFDLGPNVTLCEGESVTLYATYSAAGSYQWNSNALLNKDSLVVSTEGWYYCDIYNDVFNVTLRDSVYVTVNDKPDFDLDTLSNGTIVNTDHCIGDLVTLSTTDQGYDYLWNNGSPFLTINASSTGWYWLNADNQGCTFRDSIYLTFHEVPDFDLAPTAAYCEGESVDLTLSNLSPAGATVLWSNSATTNTITVNTAGTYTVTATNAVCNTSKSIVVTEKTKPAFDLDTLADGTLVSQDHCDGDVVTLSTTDEGYVYEWNTGSNNLNISGSTTGWYWLNADNQGCAFRDSIYLNFYEVPDFDLTTDTIICQGLSTLIEINNLTPTNASVTWDDVNNTTGTSIYINGAGTYTVTATNVVCNTSKSIIVTEVAPPVLDLSILSNGTPTDSMNCEGDVAELSYLDEGYTYTWSTGANGNNITVNQSDYYWLEASTYGCVVRDSIYMLFAVYPTMNAINDTMFCEGNSVNINITGLQPNTSEVLWNDGDNSMTKIINTGGNYQITLNNQGCYAQENFLVEEIIIPNLPFNGPTDFCFIADTGFNLTVPFYNDLNYLWLDDNSTDTLFYIDQEGQYSLEITKSICTQINTFTVIEFCALDVEIPNIVTPNDDGVNDYFKINNTDFIQSMQINIHNRWGAVVFTSDNKDVLFYPTSLADGVYFVVIDYKDYLGNEFKYKGNLTVKR